jgi:arsenite/tail-anchored protein-transporting ATPase
VSAVDALVKQLPRTTLVVGKGGVGKTTCAAALALRASSSFRTLVVSTDPARALPAVLDQPIESSPTLVAGKKGLSAQILDANALRAEFLERWGSVIRTILDRGTYLDESDIGPLVDTALPGSDEIFSALALARLIADDRDYERIVVDTAPTGHTLRLLNLPKTFRALVRLLDAMQAKHRYMVRTLTRSYRSDDADAFLAEMTRLISALEQSLGDANRCAAVIVTNAQHVVLEETRRYVVALHELHVHIGAVVWNASDAGQLDVEAPQFVVPRLEPWPVGQTGLERWLKAAGPSKKSRRATPKRASPTRAATSSKPSSQTLSDLLRPLTIVAGKGGVGKTTVAAVLAIQAADRRRTLVVSTDPAPSLADALGQIIPDADTPVQGVPKLSARQMDASAAFARLRAEYQSRVDALFEGLVARGVDMTHDRAIARDLLSLAPPGVDEVYALSLISDALFKDRYECVVVDPAPTGHLLRLLEMPQLALAWAHQLLRLMLKYKDVTGLGETAQELLEFSRSLRGVDALLRDASRCALVLVTLDEPVVRTETERLAMEVRSRAVRVAGVVLNRATVGAALPVADAPVHFEAPATDPPPIGVDALRRWRDTWTTR